MSESERFEERYEEFETEQLRDLFLDNLDKGAMGGAQPVRINDETPWPDIKKATGNVLRDNRWKSTFEEKYEREFRSEAAKCPLLRALKYELLQFGGHDIDISGGYHDVERLLERGMVFRPENLQMKRSQVNDCHANAAKIVLKQPHRFLLVNGFALYPNGVWLEHSWALNMGYAIPRLVETTFPFLLYFGYVYTHYDMMGHVAGNLDMKLEDLPESLILSYMDLLVSTVNGELLVAKRRNSNKR